MSQRANEIEVTRSGAVLHIRLNRPARRNALTWAMYEVMSEALARCARIDGENSTAVTS